MKQLFFKSAAEWRAWLKRNHALSRGVWLVYCHKKTGAPGITYRESLEEAICYGWIDSIIKNIGPGRYLRKFTPRISRDRWSPVNVRLLGELIGKRRMTEAGLAKASSQVLARARSKAPAGLPKTKGLVPRFVASALNQNSRAKEFFSRLAPSYRRQYIGWITQAKKEETRLRRLDEAVRLMALGQKLGMK